MTEQVVNSANQGAWKTGTLTAAGTTTTTVTVMMAACPMPCTVNFKSSNAARTIQLSCDEGAEYFTPTYDSTASTATQKVVTLSAPVSHVQFTGVNNDTWSIR